MLNTEYIKKWLTLRNRILTTTGFTLIEVVIALAILGVGLTVIIELFSGGLRLGKVSEEYIKAMNYASMKMEEMEGKEDVDEGIEEGAFEDHYRWQTQVKKVDLLPVEMETDSKPPVELLQIKVNILWKSGAKERSTGIESYKTVKTKENEKKS